MSLPITPNTTADIYHNPNLPPAAPDVAGVPCFLKPDFRGGMQAAELGQNHAWTHVMLIAASVDIRDWYLTAGNTAVQDTVWIPDQNGTEFGVQFAELVNRGTANEHVRVFLDRRQPPWPTTVP